MNHDNRAPAEFDRWLLEEERRQEAREGRRAPDRVEAERIEELAVVVSLQWQADKQGFGSWNAWLLALHDGLQPLTHLPYHHQQLFDHFERKWAARNARRNT